MSNDRFFAFLGENRVSLAMDIKTKENNSINMSTKELTFALAFCNHRDSFSKKIARNILNGRLDAANDESREKPVRMVFRTTYIGNHPTRDIMNPLMQKLHTLPKERKQTDVEAILQDMFLDYRHDNVVKNK